MRRLILAVLALVFVTAPAAAADGVSTWILQTEDGSRTVERFAPGAPRQEAGERPGRSDVLWHRNYTDATYTTVALCLPAVSYTHLRA
ncbi:MAG: hypothetical protein QUU85_07535, partial [Candidatus Eisenbacteria bacterium]|nr:hypothetical protein [Candidatus Eisenbacteria bacterium]